MAWTYTRRRADRFVADPVQSIVVRGVLLATSPQLRCSRGLHRSAKGCSIRSRGPTRAASDQRGVVYWEDEQGRDARILVGAGYTLFALDAATGQPIETFGTRGGVDLRAGLGDRAKALYVVANTPGTFYRNLLIQGTRVGEGPGPSAPGHVRAYDVRTGRIAWTFTRFDAAGHREETWPADAWTRVAAPTRGAA